MLSFGWLMPELQQQRPRSLLNNQPLSTLLGSTLNFRRLRRNIARGKLQALAITATGYTSGEHLTFYQSDGTIEPWRRTLRRAVPCAIGVEHLMASSSIPFMFPDRKSTRLNSSH